MMMNHRITHFFTWAQLGVTYGRR